jgi:hypothetical protein
MWSPATGRRLFGARTAPELEHDDVGVRRFAGRIGASSTGPSGTCMRPFAGSRLGGISAVPSLFERAGPERRSRDRRMQAGPERETAGRQRPRRRGTAGGEGDSSKGVGVARTATVYRALSGAIGHGKSENAANPRTGSGMQQARGRRRGGNRRGGAKPRGRNRSRRVASSARGCALQAVSIVAKRIWSGRVDDVSVEGRHESQERQGARRFGAASAPAGF